MTIDFFKLDCTILVCSDAFIIFVKMGVNVWQRSFTKDVGTGSSCLHCLLGHVRTYQCESEDANFLVNLYDRTLTDLLNKHAPEITKVVSVMENARKSVDSLI